MTPQRLVDVHRLFDDKVALSESYTFKGGSAADGDSWRKKVRGYFISKCSDLKPILNWVESKDAEEITAKAVNDAAMEWMIQYGVHDLSHAIWGFLTLCVHGEARDVFDDADEGDGLNGWRLIVKDIHKGRWVRQAQFRKLVRNPSHISKVEDVLS